MSADAVVVLDLETTGLSSVADCVWEVGAVVLRPSDDRRKWTLADRFEQTVRPRADCFNQERRDMMTRVSNLSPRQLLALWDAPPAEVVAYSVAEWLRGVLDGHQVRLTAWNLPFDKGFLESSAFPLADTLREGPGLQYLPCLMAAAAKRHLGRARWSLADACQRFGVTPTGHRALSDAATAALVAIHAEVLPPLRTDPPVVPAKIALADEPPVEQHHGSLAECQLAAEATVARLAQACVQPLFARTAGHVEKVGYAVHTPLARVAVHRVRAGA